MPCQWTSQGYIQQVSRLKLAELLQQDQQALLAALHDPSGVYAQQLLGGKDGGCGAAGGHQHPTPRSSLDVMALGRSAYSSPRSSFEVPQVLPDSSLFRIVVSCYGLCHREGTHSCVPLLLCTLHVAEQLWHASMFISHPAPARRTAACQRSRVTNSRCRRCLLHPSLVDQHLSTGQDVRFADCSAGCFEMLVMRCPASGTGVVPASPKDLVLHVVPAVGISPGQDYRPQSTRLSRTSYKLPTDQLHALCRDVKVASASLCLELHGVDDHQIMDALDNLNTGTYC